MLGTGDWIAIAGVGATLVAAIGTILYMNRRSLLIELGDGSAVVNTVMRFEQTTAFLMHLVITNTSPQRTITIETYHLQVPWKDDYLHPLPDAEELGKEKFYRFMGTELSYPRDEVINHRCLAEGHLAAGQTISGMFLAQGLADIPFNYYRDDWVQVIVVITDSTGKVYKSKNTYIHPSPSLPGIQPPLPPNPIMPRPSGD